MEQRQYLLGTEIVVRQFLDCWGVGILTKSDPPIKWVRTFEDRDTAIRVARKALAIVRMKYNRHTLN